ncbi:hypothetical protein EfmAA94_29770 (plasmid) [Enterococcus faecium]|nr:hypothetical protein EfmAA94_29770 [Enterococcus faecium]
MNLDQADTMKGGFLQPTSDPLPANHGYKKIGILSGLGGEIFTYHFFIPQAASSYLEFVEQIFTYHFFIPQAASSYLEIEILLKNLHSTI